MKNKTLTITQTKSSKSFSKIKPKTPRETTQTSFSSSKKESDLYNSLKPVVNDFTKACKKESPIGKDRCKTTSRTSFTQSPKETGGLKLKFQDTKDFNIEEFIKSHTDDHLKCIVCAKLLVEPVTCYKCSKYFCSLCIKSELEKHNKCPGCYNIVFQELMPIIDIDDWEIIKGKEIKCPFIGCKEKYSLMVIRSHLETCIFKLLKSRAKQHVNKIIYQDSSKDPQMKTHLLNYLKVSNSKITPPNINEKKNNLTTEFEFTSKLSDLNIHIGYVNDTFSKTILNLAIATKSTNEKLKTMINS